MIYAPIALFVYNRPEHTKLTVNALAKNTLATKSDLFVFSDGPRHADAGSAVAEVRAYIRTISGFRSVHLVEREHNLGLARSIIDGVGKLCTEYGRVIVVEDDIVTSRHFLSYMNDALNYYKHEERVMHVSGYMFPVTNPETLPETFFYRATSCWGWATWSRAWQHFEPNANVSLNQIYAGKMQTEFDVGGTMPYVKMLRSQLKGEIDSWAVRWYASVFLRGGQCLHPRYSLVSNIGMDGSGVHCNKTDQYAASLSDSRITVETIKVVAEDRYALLLIKKFNASLIPPWPKRLMRFLGKYLKRIKKS